MDVFNLNKLLIKILFPLRKKKDFIYYSEEIFFDGSDGRQDSIY